MAPYTGPMPKPSIYQALADHLTVQPPDVQLVTLTLEEIGTLIGRPVSATARQPGWWVNSGNKSHVRALRRADWRVLRAPGVHYGPRVTFERVPAG